MALCDLAMVFVSVHRMSHSKQVVLNQPPWFADNHWLFEHFSRGRKYTIVTFGLGVRRHCLTKKHSTSSHDPVRHLNVACRCGTPTGHWSGSACSGCQSGWGQAAVSAPGQPFLTGARIRSRPTNLRTGSITSSQLNSALKCQVCPCAEVPSLSVWAPRMPAVEVCGQVSFIYDPGCPSHHLGLLAFTSRPPAAGCHAPFD